MDYTAKNNPKNDHIVNYLFLLFIVIPPTWAVFDNKCILTIIENKISESKALKNNDEPGFLFRLFGPMIKQVCRGLDDKQITNIINKTFVFMHIFFIVYFMKILYKRKH